MPKFNLKKISIVFLILNLLIVSNANAKDPGGGASTIEEINKPVSEFLVNVFLFYVAGYFLVYFGANILSIAMDPSWLTIITNDMVRSVWYFTSGFANMLIVIFLVIIAFAYILNIEGVQARKSLPKLIIAALLINFSLLFISMFTDIAQIIWKAILQEQQPGDLLKRAFENLTGGAEATVLSLATSIVGLASCYLLPFASVACQLSLVITFATVLFPQFIMILFSVVSFLLLGSTFLIYAFLFGARVFIIQLLAILSPIAIVCWIFPQTKKFWDEWLHHFVQWTFLGLALLFFLIIWLKMSLFVQPPGMAFVPIASFFFLPQLFVYYFFLFIYLIISIWVSQRFMPSLATFLIQQGKDFGTKMWKQGLRPLSTATRKAVPRALARSERIVKFGKRLEESNVPILRMLGSKIGTSLQEARLQEVLGHKKQAEEIQTPEMLKKALIMAFNEGNFEKLAGIILEAIERGGEFKKEVATKNHRDLAVSAIELLEKLGDKKSADKIRMALLTEDNIKDTPFLQRIGFKEDSDLPNFIKNVNERDYKYFAEDFWKTSTTMYAITQLPAYKLRELIKTFKGKFVEDYMGALTEEIQRINSEFAHSRLPILSEETRRQRGETAIRDILELIRRNPSVARFLERSFFREFGGRSIFELISDELRQELESMGIRNVEDALRP